MQSKSAWVPMFLCGAIVAGSTILALAGPLDPPAGPVTPTYKTLTEVEPRIPINAANTPGDADSLYRIAQPGSYYLTGGVTGVSGKSGIEIASDHVTLDLMGFTVTGVPGSLSGIAASGSATSINNVTIRNGVIRSFVQDGINLRDGTPLPGASRVVESVYCFGNGGRGIVMGRSSSVRNCCVEQNGAGGIDTSTACVVESCTARTGNAFGISVAAGSVVRGCTSTGALTDGIVAAGSTVTDCTVSFSVDGGFVVTAGCLVRGCTATENAGTGIDAAGGCTIVDCAAFSNNDRGIVASDGCTVRTCTARENGTAGISAAMDSVVMDCTATLNTLDGIVAGPGARIVGNTCAANGSTSTGAAIHVTSNLGTGKVAVVDGNAARGGQYGINLEGSCIVLRNIASGTAGQAYRNAITGNNIESVLPFEAPTYSGSSGGSPLHPTNNNWWLNFAR